MTDQKTAADMREMMEDVVLEGTGKPAQLSGYTAAGKSEPRRRSTLPQDAIRRPNTMRHLSVSPP